MASYNRSRDANRQLPYSAPSSSPVWRSAVQQSASPSEESHSKHQTEPTWKTWRQGFTRTCDEYEKIEKIGEGTYGQVYKARHRREGHLVAMKKMRVHPHQKKEDTSQGYPLTAVREIKILKRLSHENMVCMHQVVTSKSARRMFDRDDPDEEVAASSAEKEAGSGGLLESFDRVGDIFIVLEYVDHDLSGLLDQYQFRAEEVKCIMRQLLEVLKYIHEEKFVHRDLKCSNLLLSADGTLKLADFGLARSFEPTFTTTTGNKTLERLTNNVITLWYRPPELLLGLKKYNCAVDMWSAGCILAELVLRKPLFPGKTELEQVNLIFKVMGTPTQGSWPHHEELPRFNQISPKAAYPVVLAERYGERLGKCDKHALALLQHLLNLDPSRRKTAKDALSHLFFRGFPATARQPLRVDKDAAFHEWKTKEAKRKLRLQQQQQQQQQPPPAHSSSVATHDPFVITQDDIAQSASASNQRDNQPPPSSSSSSAAAAAAVAMQIPSSLPPGQQHQLQYQHQQLQHQQPTGYRQHGQFSSLPYFPPQQQQQQQQQEGHLPHRDFSLSGNGNLNTGDRRGYGGGVGGGGIGAVPVPLPMAPKPLPPPLQEPHPPFPHQRRQQQQEGVGGVSNNDDMDIAHSPPPPPLPRRALPPPPPPSPPAGKPESYDDIESELDAMAGRPKQAAPLPPPSFKTISSSPPSEFCMEAYVDRPEATNAGIAGGGGGAGAADAAPASHSATTDTSRQQQQQQRRRSRSRSRSRSGGGGDKKKKSKSASRESRPHHHSSSSSSSSSYQRQGGGDSRGEGNDRHRQNDRGRGGGDGYGDDHRRQSSHSGGGGGGDRRDHRGRYDERERDRQRSRSHGRRRGNRRSSRSSSSTSMSSTSSDSRSPPRHPSKPSQR